MTLLAVALGALLAGGFGAAAASRRGALSSALALGGVLVASVAGAWLIARVLAGAWAPGVAFAPSLPFGPYAVAVDPLSATFLAPVFGLAPLAAVYARAYLGPTPRRRKALHWLAFNLLVASMVVVVIARHAFLFLGAWEVMSLCAYVLVTYEHERAEVTRAGWTYLIATHVGTAFLLAFFQIMAGRTGTFGLQPASAPAATGLFVLAVLGFGVKAGLAPLHVWLPEAHGAAPSHVSAVMSGVVIKMGIYGVLRAWLLVGDAARWWGPALMTVGIGGALLGISTALYQRDLKRVLAYSSVENVGVIAIGVGVGMWGATTGRADIAGLGLTGALLHVWNHSALKGLLFMAAGSVLHGARSRDLERLGGLMKRMPATATAFVVGAVGIAALPPLGAFASEWLIYLALVKGLLVAEGATAVALAVAVALVSVIGAMTLLCFVRVLGVALQGAARSPEAREAHESPRAMTAVLALLAALAVGMAAAPHLLARALSAAIVELVPAATPASDALQGIAMAAGVLMLALALGALALRRLTPKPRARDDETWGCGYAAPSARMQYTGGSFSEALVGGLLPSRVGPRATVALPDGTFPGRARHVIDPTDPLTRGAYEPLLARAADGFARLRWMQQGSLHAYLVYIAVALLGLLVWVSLPTAWGGP